MSFIVKSFIITMPVCSFANCLTGSKSKHIVQINNNRPIVCHRFPKDVYFRKLWQQKCGKKNINFESGIILYLFYVIH